MNTSMKVTALVVAAVVAIGAVFAIIKHSESKPSNNEDLKVIIGKTILPPQVDPLIAMLAVEMANNSNKKIDTDVIIKQFHVAAQQPQNFAKFEKVYTEHFSADELSELRKMIENPVFEKYLQENSNIAQTQLAVVRQVLTDLINDNAGKGTDEKSYYSGRPNQVIELTDKNFDQIMKGGKPVIIDVYASWCQACIAMAPAYEELSNEFNDVAFTKLNYDLYKNLIGKYTINGLPTLIFLKSNGESKVIMGMKSKEELRALVQHFKG